MTNIRIVVTLVLSLIGVSASFAQAPIVPTAPAVTAPATPAATTPATPDFKVTGMTPASVVSATNEFPKLVTLRGANLDKIDIDKLKFSDGSTDLSMTLADQPKTTFASLTVTIPAAAKGEFVLSVDGTDTKFKLVVKDADQIAAEKAEAERKQLIANAKAGAAAAVKVNKIEAAMATLTNRVNALPAPAATMTAEEIKAEIDRRVDAALRDRVFSPESQIQVQLKALADNVSEQVGEVNALTIQNTADINGLANNVQVKRGKTSHTITDDIAARTAATLERLRKEGKIQD